MGCGGYYVIEIEWLVYFLGCYKIIEVSYVIYQQGFYFVSNCFQFCVVLVFWVCIFFGDDYFGMEIYGFFF